MRGCNHNSIMFCALATDMECIQDYPVNFRRLVITHLAIHPQASVPDLAYILMLLVPVCSHRGGQDFKLQAAVSAAGSHSCKDYSAGAQACNNAIQHGWRGFHALCHASCLATVLAKPEEAFI